MIDAIWEILVKIFDYFFAINAPMTIMIIGWSGGLWYYLRMREQSILQPLEVAKHKSILIKIQMDMAERILDRLHAMLYGLYRHQRRVALEAQGMTTTEARDHLEMDMPTFMHSLQLWGVHGAIRSEIRSFFRDNHLADRTEKDFKDYLNVRKADVWTALVAAMNEYWFSGMTSPSRSDMYDVHEQNQNDILDLVEEIFVEGRRIAIEYQEKLSPKIRQKFADFGGFF
jgi:hypothetical protein